ncbi:MAG TPA: single-stranded-DNA-specific exonuclease RecJ [Rudaea sp.]|nr:single-stranded-DNA-specific exonuclease RecJ [Rudaea sp.]
MKSPRIVRRPLPAFVPELPVHPVLRRIFAARGVTSPAQVEYRLAGILPPNLGGLDRACAIIGAAIRARQRIVVVGDFDCDGATGTAVAVRGLRLLGARNVGYGVPNRAVHGYGLSPALVEELSAQRPDLLITVDNGVAAHAGIAAAQARGIRVVVTDHHLPGATLPEADAMVNPNLPGDAFPSKALAGVGVMFYLLLALRASLRTQGWFAETGVAEPDLSSLLDLVALGTVADLVALDYNNRILVEAGLRRIRAGRACAGIAALFVCGKRDWARASAADLGFVVAPRLNAAGRIDDISLGIECLLADDAARARELADRLSALNAERRELQSDMTGQAEATVNQWISRHGSAALPFGLVLFEADWHQGVVGLVASRLKEMLNRPVIACAPAGAGSDEVKGSGRSIAGFHLRDVLAEVDAANPGLLGRFGGHAMAAGLSLRRDALERFAMEFDQATRRRLLPEQLDAVLPTDGELGSADYTLELARQLRSAGPWGQAFPEPLFDGEFDIAGTRPIGEAHLRLKLRQRGGGGLLDAVLFNADRCGPLPSSIRAAFQLEIDEWDGAQSLRLLLRHVEPL